MELPSGLPRTSFSGRVYRVVRRGADPLSLQGSTSRGGRYNRPGTGALYTSLEAETATAEVVRGLRLRGIDPEVFGPEDWWQYEIMVEAGKILDLTAPDTLAQLGVAAVELTTHDDSGTRALADGARSAGYQGILAPSAAFSGKTNLVLFLDTLTQPVEVLSSIPAPLMG